MMQKVLNFITIKINAKKYSISQLFKHLKRHYFHIFLHSTKNHYRFYSYIKVWEWVPIQTLQTSPKFAIQIEINYFSITGLLYHFFLYLIISQKTSKQIRSPLLSHSLLFYLKKYWDVSLLSPKFFKNHLNYQIPYYLPFYY